MKINGLLKILLSILPLSVLCACVMPNSDDTMPYRTFSRIPKPKPIIVKDLNKKISKESTEDKDQKVVSKEEEVLALIWPLKGKVVRGFKSIDEEGKKSSGITILSERPNVQVRSAMDGIVTYAGPHKKFLNALVITNGNIKIAYGYLEGNLPVAGSRITAGQILGTISGKKGKAILYLAVQKDGTAVNPLDYLP